MKAFFTITFSVLCLLTFGQNINVSNGNIFDGEPYLAIDPTNDQHLVAAWMGFEVGQKVVIRTSYSDDGGITWSSPNYLAHDSVGNASADPSLAYDNNGNLYVVYVDYDNTNFTAGGVYIRKSTDGGITWGASTEAINITDCPNQVCIDRPWIAVDQNGTVFITTMNADQPTLVTAPYHPYVVVSNDQGSTFTNPIIMDAPNYLAGSLIKQPMPSPAIGNDGTFYAAYPSYVFTQSVTAQIILAKSTDNATTFSHSIVYNGGGGPQDNFAKVGTLLITNPTNANHLVLLSPMDFNGDIDIYMTETTDGTNWSAPIRINQDGISNGKMQDLVWADFNENGDLAVCWRDRRNGSANGYQTETEIYGTVRFAGNTNFEPDFAVSSQQANHDAVLENAGNDFMNVQFRGDTLYALWGDVRTGTLNIFLNKTNIINGNSSTTEVYNEQNILSVYPNPAQNEITITSFEQATNVELYSIDGVFIQKIEQKKLDIQQLKSGKYLIKFTYKNQQYSTKFVKK